MTTRLVSRLPFSSPSYRFVTMAFHSRTRHHVIKITGSLRSEGGHLIAKSSTTVGKEDFSKTPFRQFLTTPRFITFE